MSNTTEQKTTDASGAGNGRVGSGALFGGLDNFERMAVYNAHMKVADRYQGYADEARAKAAERGPIWERWLKRALIFDRQARERTTRARMFLPNPQLTGPQGPV